MNTLTFTREDIIRRTSEKLDTSHNDMKLALDSVLEAILTAGAGSLEHPSTRPIININRVFFIKSTYHKIPKPKIFSLYLY